MFGYVSPCKMELKIKDYEKYKAYYCGLCKAIKKNFGNLPRLALNYDMTFLAILLDALEEKNFKYEAQRCGIHLIKKRVVIVNNKALDYAAFCNVALVYFKLLDDVKDDKTLKSKFLSIFIKPYLKKSYREQKVFIELIESKLNNLSIIEKETKHKSLDEISHPFAELTGELLMYMYSDKEYKETLYKLGYNLGKWIYIIDAFDDLEKDMKEKKFNAINKAFNLDDIPYVDFIIEIEKRVDFVLVASAANCERCLKQLPIKKNQDLVDNILKYGLMEKMDKVFKRSDCNNEKSI